MKIGTMSSTRIWARYAAAAAKMPALTVREIFARSASLGVITVSQ